MGTGPEGKAGGRERAAGGAPTVDRRRHERFGIPLAVTLTTSDGTEITGVSRDVSLGGVFIPCHGAPAPGTDCRLELALGVGPARVAIRVQGRVARVDADGVAVQYTYIDADNHARLHELFASAAVPTGDP
jgi:hypothetical protein